VSKNHIDGNGPGSQTTARALPSALASGARELGVSLTAEQIGGFARYTQELLDWNRRMNLTAITEPRDVEIRHFLDSLTAVTALAPDVRDGGKVVTLLDVGAGAGLPGIPLAIVRPNLRVMLLEATQKKCRFLDHVRQTLALPNLTVVCGRAEELAHRPDLRAGFDVVVARAVAPLATLVELCLPFVTIGGQLVAFKKVHIEAEVAAASRAIRQLGGRLARPVKATPPAYPRRPGLPAKAPL
jgi:16S rRNA (guanine527-N7)-methyltransferase